MIDTGIDSNGEEYLAFVASISIIYSYNVRRWGSDTWVRSLKKSGEKDGATFRNWK